MYDYIIIKNIGRCCWGGECWRGGDTFGRTIPKNLLGRIRRSFGRAARIIMDYYSALMWIPSRPRRKRPFPSRCAATARTPVLGTLLPLSLQRRSFGEQRWRSFPKHAMPGALSVSDPSPPPRAPPASALLRRLARSARSKLRAQG